MEKSEVVLAWCPGHTGVAGDELLAAWHLLSQSIILFVVCNLVNPRFLFLVLVYYLDATLGESMCIRNHMALAKYNNRRQYVFE
jgi:hypothetical protein